MLSFSADVSEDASGVLLAQVCSDVGEHCASWASTGEREKKTCRTLSFSGGGIEGKLRVDKGHFLVNIS